MNNTSVLVWSTVNWALVYKRVRRIQRRIYKARLGGNLSKVHYLQKILISSLDAKLVATHQVTTLNKGKKTAGVDKQIFVKDSEKLHLALNLSLNGKACPIRRVWIPKPGKDERRPLGIPTITDRARQALAKLALEPEWEAVFEPNSYGFRPGRSPQDAIEAIFLSLRHKTPKVIFDADIKKCFDKIDHQSLLQKLNTFPQMEKQINAWLKAEIMEGYANNPKDVSSPTLGTPQGGIISPLLANIALHGLENYLKEFVAGLDIPGFSGSIAKSKSISVIRYADDFVLIHRDPNVLNLCIDQTKNWLSRIGLEISEEKSSIRDGREGFLFLGFQIIQVVKAGNYKVKIHPSKASKLRLLSKVRQVIQNNKSASAYQLIMILRPLIIGWANYYKFSECKEDFSTLTHLIFQKIRAWVFRRDTRNGRKFIKQKYFPSGKTYTFDGTTHQDNWILFGTYKSQSGIREAFLPHIVWVKSRKFVKIKGASSPYNNDLIYWSQRTSKYSVFSTRVRTLLKKQKGKCASCKLSFEITDVMEIDHIIPKFKGGKDLYSNLQLLHRQCHVKKTASESKFWKNSLEEDI